MSYGVAVVAKTDDAPRLYLIFVGHKTLCFDSRKGIAVIREYAIAHLVNSSSTFESSSCNVAQDN
jgi:hypothetical protein